LEDLPQIDVRHLEFARPETSSMIARGAQMAQTFAETSVRCASTLALLAGSAVLAGVLSLFVLRGAAGSRQRVLTTMARSE
jgi:hypothetical protein